MRVLCRLFISLVMAERSGLELNVLIGTSMSGIVSPYDCGLIDSSELRRARCVIIANVDIHAIRIPGGMVT